MAPADHTSDPTSIAVAIGELKTQVTMGFQNVQDSIDKLTKASENQAGRLGELETKTAVQASRIDGVEKTLNESKPEKGRAWGITGVLAAVAVGILQAVQWLIGIGASH